MCVEGSVHVIVITWPRGRWLIYHPRRFAPEGDKSVKRPRGHVITSLLQFERTSV